MVNQATSTLTPEQEEAIPDLAPITQPPTNSASPGREFLFDSIANENIGADHATSASPWKAAFTGLLWVGYSIAIAIALVLVWSSARELLR